MNTIDSYTHLDGYADELGSGSLEQDSLLSIVAVKKEAQPGLVHRHRLGKRQRHAHKSGKTLP